MKKIFCSLVIMLMLVSCNRSDTVIKNISGEQAKELMDTRNDITIVDVREQSEYDSGHIANAILLPLGNIAADAEAMLPDKEAAILLYCRSGRRSASAAAKLAELGYTDIYDFGGIVSWQYDITM